VHAAGASDLVLRNVNTGAFEGYDIANNQLTGPATLGQVGLDWQLAASPPIPRPHRAHPWATQVRLLSSSKQWRVSVAAPQPRA
jgi:hypothetical protein